MEAIVRGFFKSQYLTDPKITLSNTEISLRQNKTFEVWEGFADNIPVCVTIQTQNILGLKVVKYDTVIGPHREIFTRITL